MSTDDPRFAHGGSPPPESGEVTHGTEERNVPGAPPPAPEASEAGPGSTAEGVLPEPRPSAPPGDAAATAQTEEKTSRLSRLRAFITGDRRVTALVAATGVLAVATVLLALMVFAPGAAPVKTGLVSAAAQEQDRQDVRAVAERFAEALYNFNYESIDRDIDRIRTDATGGFEQELQRVLGDVETYRRAIVEAQAVSEGRVQGTEIRSLSDTSASARVFVLRTIQNRNNPEPRATFDAVELSLVRTNQGWKVDDVKQFRPEEVG